MDLPPVTGCYLAGSLFLSTLVQCNFANAFQLFYAPRPVFVHGQTNFLFFGELSLDFCFHLFFFARYSKMLENGVFSGRSADFLWLLVVCATLLLVLAPLSPSPFLSSPLSFTLVYIWSRLNPHVRLSLFGAVTITAPNLPYALVVFSWALSSSWSGVIGDLLGIVVGHFYYFFAFVWKTESWSGKKNWLKTPYPIVYLIHGAQEAERLTREEPQPEAQPDAPAPPAAEPIVAQ